MFDNTEKFVKHILALLNESKHQTLLGFTGSRFDSDNAFNVWMYHHAMSAVSEIIEKKLESYKKGELYFD